MRQVEVTPEDDEAGTPTTDEGGPSVLDRRPAALDGQEAWLDGVGISSRHERELELGSGKWTEPARSLDEVRAGMPNDPIRQLRISPRGFSWRPTLAAVLILAIAGWLLWRHRGRGMEDHAAEPAPAPVASGGGPRFSEEVAAAADAPEVTVWTDLEGARIELDGRDHGPAPTRVPVPLDTNIHELCLLRGEARTCRSLTGEQLAQDDPYPFTLGGDGR